MINIKIKTKSFHNLTVKVLVEKVNNKIGIGIAFSTLKRWKIEGTTKAWIYSFVDYSGETETPELKKEITEWQLTIMGISVGYMNAKTKRK